MRQPRFWSQCGHQTARGFLSGSTESSLQHIVQSAHERSATSSLERESAAMTLVTFGVVRAFRLKLSVVFDANFVQ